MDKISKEKRSWNMSRIRSKDTKPELKVRSRLFRIGYRYRINYPIPGKPDIVFPKKKIAIFVHGCFWHRHGCKNSVMPKTNTEFWKKKLEGNKKRDMENIRKLKNEGWKPITIWECEIKDNFEKSVKKIVDKLKSF